MKEQIKNIITKLEKHIQDAYVADDEDEFTESLCEIRDELEETEDSFQAIEPILKLIESNEDLDYGGPGPLAHFMESFSQKGYEDQLIKSLERKPTEYTLHLLHRIMNDKDDPDHKKYLGLMKSISLNNQLPENIIEEAKDSLSYFKND